MVNRWKKLKDFIQLEMGFGPPPPRAQDRKIPEPASLVINGQEIQLQFVPNHKARNYIMRFREEGVLRVTIPRMGSMRQARAFVEKNRDWIAKHYDKIRTTPKSDRSWRAGGTILFRGEPTLIEVVRDESGQLVVQMAQHLIKLHGQMAPENLRPVVEAYLKQIAASELPEQLARLAREHNVQFARVTIRAQRSRWGSCSTRKTISINWRLIHTPAFVQEYILIHELMHLREMNHSRRFWAHVEAACPDYRIAEKWLNQNKVLSSV